MSFKRCNSFCAAENTLADSFFEEKLKSVRDYLSEYLFELAAITLINSFEISIPSASILRSDSSYALRAY
jgi:hypothetical protein